MIFIVRKTALSRESNQHPITRIWGPVSCSTGMENAKAKEVKNATVTKRSDGEDWNGAREERCGEANYSKRPCLSEQSKTISFNVLLLRTSHNTTTNRTFTTTKFPESVAALKLAIQEEFQVSVYDQKLSFGSTVMADGESLDFYRLKDGDQITLEYTTTVDVECAFHLMSLLRNALEFVKNEQCQLASGKISPEFSKMISDTLHVKDIDQCIRQLFPSEKLLANSDFILKNGGLDVITSLHSLLLKQTWDNICHLDLQYLEKHVLFLLGSLYIVFPHHLKYKVVNSLDNVIGSFLRVPISSKHIAVPQNLNLPDTTRSQQFIVLVEVLCGAIQSLTQQVMLQISYFKQWGIIYYHSPYNVTHHHHLITIKPTFRMSCIDNACIYMYSWPLDTSFTHFSCPPPPPPPPPRPYLNI